MNEDIEVKDEAISSIINAFSHLSTALRMRYDKREKGFQLELKCAVEEINEHCDLIEVEYNDQY